MLCDESSAAAITNPFAVAFSLGICLPRPVGVADFVIAGGRLWLMAESLTRWLIIDAVLAAKTAACASGGGAYVLALSDRRRFALFVAGGSCPAFVANISHPPGFPGRY